MEALWRSGATVQAYDPVATVEAKRIYSMQNKLKLFDDKYEALQGVDALVICTEWQQFRVPDLEEMASRMRKKIIIDGRNLYSPEKLTSVGWEYMAIGRASARVN